MESFWHRQFFFLANSMWYALTPVGFLMTFVTYLILNTGYEVVTNQTLIIKAGFLQKTEIDVLSIHKIEFTRDATAAPALSLDRIRLYYNAHDSVLISPKHKTSFIKDLLTVNPEIRVEWPEDSTFNNIKKIIS